MARFSYNDADNYGGNGKSSYFSLRNDKDTARVRFMYNGMEDVEGFAIHEIKTPDGGKKYVNCLREYNEPRSKCPFCEAGEFQKAKIFVPLYNVEEDCVQIWERGKKFFGKLSSICGRYVKSNTPLVSTIFEIERNGQPGDQQTTYEIYNIETDDVRMSDLPEVPNILGTMILDKSADEMREYLRTGEFPEGKVSRQSEDREPVGRRTPSRRGDNF